MNVLICRYGLHGASCFLCLAIASISRPWQPCACGVSAKLNSADESALYDFSCRGLDSQIRILFVSAEKNEFWALRENTQRGVMRQNVQPKSVLAQTHKNCWRGS